MKASTFVSISGLSCDSLTPPLDLSAWLAEVPELGTLVSTPPRPLLAVVAAALVSTPPRPLLAVATVAVGVALVVTELRLKPVRDLEGLVQSVSVGVNGPLGKQTDAGSNSRIILKEIDV